MLLFLALHIQLVINSCCITFWIVIESSCHFHPSCCCPVLGLYAPITAVASWVESLLLPQMHHRPSYGYPSNISRVYIGPCDFFAYCPPGLSLNSSTCRGFIYLFLFGLCDFFFRTLWLFDGISIALSLDYVSAKPCLIILA